MTDRFDRLNPDHVDEDDLYPLEGIHDRFARLNPERNQNNKYAIMNRNYIRERMAFTFKLCGAILIAAFVMGILIKH